MKICKQYNKIGKDQGLFWQYHDILYSNWTGENNGWASPENLTLLDMESSSTVPTTSKYRNFGKKIN